jgi:hypothetical protein
VQETNITIIKQAFGSKIYLYFAFNLVLIDARAALSRSPNSDGQFDAFSQVEALPKDVPPSLACLPPLVFTVLKQINGELCYFEQQNASCTGR